MKCYEVKSSSSSKVWSDEVVINSDMMTFKYVNIQYNFIHIVILEEQEIYHIRVVNNFITLLYNNYYGWFNSLWRTGE